MIWKEFIQAFKCKKKKLKYSSAPLNSFLNSAINIEFVYLILTGINQALELDHTISAKSFFSSSGIKVNRNGNRTRFTLNDIFIDNHNSKWDISKKSKVFASNTENHVLILQSGALSGNFNDETDLRGMPKTFDEIPHVLIETSAEMQK